MTEPTYNAYQSFKGQRNLHSQGASPGSLPPTPSDIEGPFYKPGAPITTVLRDPPQLYLSGKVTDTAGNPVEVILDFWQANEQGVYSNTSPCDEDYDLRGKQQTDYRYTESLWQLSTVRPGHYKISDPGQPDEFRCSHIHVKVTAKGFKPLTTQLYFADDEYDKTDHWFQPALCIRFDERPDVGTFDFVLEKE